MEMKKKCIQAVCPVPAGICCICVFLAFSESRKEKNVLFFPFFFLSLWQAF